MTEFQIDINADVGEGLNNEEALLPHLSSCNIACGGHAGDNATMTAITKLAKEYQVKIGAHPSFPDKANFGRRPMEISCSDLFQSLKNQIMDMVRITQAQNAKLHHIKPHGALYNLAAYDKSIASTIVDVIHSIDSNLKLYAPYDSVIAAKAMAENIEVVFEAFADRNYNNDLSLVSRQNENAIITNTEQVLSHVVRIVKENRVKTIEGVEKVIKASTLCVHGDTENAIEILRYLNDNLPKFGIGIQ
ncbi:5-oxoprolinase subunit PxpA [Winogradskyella aurantia]|uniref:Lactam utilization protein LamB n=1 Tax=Winogradskyella aurantia TaxID=1915063 RepID=A0A265UXC7_9FLAO|nr:5-oxoprolinase subunit PxpA [Winogradskyella aurantia]OZV69959.1 lactam utilization protein LamB [Winogradskyella aurantia]